LSGLGTKVQAYTIALRTVDIFAPFCKADCELRAEGWCWLALARQAEPVDPLNASNQDGGRGDFLSLINIQYS